jgi:PhnB protein
MASKPAPNPQTRQTATPYLAVQDASAAIDFYKKVFGAVEMMRLVGPDSKIGHAEIRIGNSTIFLSDEYPDYGAVSPQSLGGSAVKINLYVDSVDEVAGRAVAAGAKVVQPVQDQFYGERSGQFEDPFGYTWIISTAIEEVSAAEMQRRFDAIMTQSPDAAHGEKSPPPVKPIPAGFHSVTPYLIVPEASRLMEFIKKAFGAEEKLRVHVPGSEKIMHAELKVGDSMIEMADASPEHPAMPYSIHFYVPNADAAYERALFAGGKSRRAPEDTSYGDRSAAVNDPFGNAWFIATRIKDVKLKL